MPAVASALHFFDLSRRLRDPAVFKRAALFGAGWGLTFSSAMTALHTYQNGCLCVDEAVWYAVVSIVVGVFAIGPVTLIKVRH